MKTVKNYRVVKPYSGIENGEIVTCSDEMIINYMINTNYWVEIPQEPETPKKADMPKILDKSELNVKILDKSKLNFKKHS